MDLSIIGGVSAALVPGFLLVMNSAGAHSFAHKKGGSPVSIRGQLLVSASNLQSSSETLFCGVHFAVKC